MKREADEDVSLVLELASLCEIFHCLPSPGGLLDQDPKLMYMIREVLMAKGEKAELERKSSRGI